MHDSGKRPEPQRNQRNQQSRAQDPHEVQRQQQEQKQRDLEKGRQAQKARARWEVIVASNPDAQARVEAEIRAGLEPDLAKIYGAVPPPEVQFREKIRVERLRVEKETQRRAELQKNNPEAYAALLEQERADAETLAAQARAGRHQKADPAYVPPKRLRQPTADKAQTAEKAKVDARREALEAKERQRALDKANGIIHPSDPDAVIHYISGEDVVLSPQEREHAVQKDLLPPLFAELREWTDNMRAHPEVPMEELYPKSTPHPTDRQSLKIDPQPSTQPQENASVPKATEPTRFAPQPTATVATSELKSGMMGAFLKPELTGQVQPNPVSRIAFQPSDNPSINPPKAAEPAVDAVPQTLKAAPSFGGATPTLLRLVGVPAAGAAVVWATVEGFFARPAVAPEHSSYFAPTRKVPTVPHTVPQPLGPLPHPKIAAPIVSPNPTRATQDQEAAALLNRQAQERRQAEDARQARNETNDTEYANQKQQSEIRGLDNQNDYDKKINQITQATHDKISAMQRQAHAAIFPVPVEEQQQGSFLPKVVPIEPKPSTEPAKIDPVQSQPVTSKAKEPTLQEPTTAKKDEGKGAQEKQDEGKAKASDKTTTENPTFKSTGQPIAGRSLDELTPAERTELEQTYDIATRKEDGRKIFKRRGKDDGTSGLHSKLVDGKWVIQDGLSSQTSGRISDPNKTRKNFAQKYEIKVNEIPEDLQMSHLEPDRVWQGNPLTQEASRRGVAGIDDAENLIAQPSTAAAFDNNSKEVQDLEKQGGLAKVIHNGSHKSWNDFSQQTLDDARSDLQKQYPGKTLQEMPNEAIKKAITNAETTLREELRRVAEDIKKGDFSNIPKWVDRDYLPKDGQGKKYPRLSENEQIDNIENA